MATIFDVADYFRWCVDYGGGDNITQLKLQKLCYYAQAWHLAFTGKPLFEEEFEAWPHGPVSRALRAKYRKSGWQSIPPGDIHRSFDPARALTDDESNTLQIVWNKYGGFTATRLEELTHQEYPWRAARGALPSLARSRSIILREHMAQFYGGSMPSQGVMTVNAQGDVFRMSKKQRQEMRDRLKAQHQDVGADDEYFAVLLSEYKELESLRGRAVSVSDAPDS
ncbi:MAG: Panacea domain-containing protein [Bacilli bacterium]